MPNYIKEYLASNQDGYQEACQMQVDISRNKIEKVDQKLPLSLKCTQLDAYQEARQIECQDSELLENTNISCKDKL